MAVRFKDILVLREVRMPEDIQGSILWYLLLIFLLVTGKCNSNKSENVSEKLSKAVWALSQFVTFCQPRLDKFALNVLIFAREKFLVITFGGVKDAFPLHGMLKKSGK